MATITFPLELFIETGVDKLPNGPYCLGGPAGNTINKLDAHVPEYTTQAKLREIVMAHLLMKLAESGSSGGQPMPGKTSTNSPNTVQFVGGLFPTGIVLSIDSIRFLGGELALHEQELTAGDGYEVVFSQSVVCTSACCKIS
jgi:hypothetical protein